MIQQIYSVYDQASGIYQRPFPASTHGEVTRSFTDIATDADHEIGKHPEDYTLFCLGSFNDGTGELISWPTPEKIVTALECVSMTRNVNKDNLEELHQNLKAGGDA